MYPIKAIIGRAKDILWGLFQSSTTIHNLTVEESPQKSNYISLILIIKNEAKYIREWIEYHKLIGVEHFYIYDNESSDNLHQVLESYIRSGLISYISIQGQCVQIKAYNDAIARFKDKNHWMGFIDSDEFIVLTQNNNIKDFLKEFEQEYALGVNWIMFDANGHEQEPDHGFVIENFTRTYKNRNHPNNRLFKTIVRPSKVKRFNNPHFCILKNNLKIVDENHTPITLPCTKISSTTRIRINHYFSKSKQELVTKINRGRADIKQKRNFQKSLYDFSNEGTQSSDHDLTPYIERLKNIIPETYTETSK